MSDGTAEGEGDGNGDISVSDCERSGSGTDEEDGSEREDISPSACLSTIARISKVGNSIGTGSTGRVLEVELEGILKHYLPKVIKLPKNKHQRCSATA